MNHDASPRTAKITFWIGLARAFAARVSKRHVSEPHRQRRQCEDEADRRQQPCKPRTDRIEAAAEIAAPEFFVDRLAHRNAGPARAALPVRAVAREAEIAEWHAKIPIGWPDARGGERGPFARHDRRRDLTIP